MQAQPRDVQTQVKHRILDDYLGAWAGIILQGINGRAARANQRFDVHLVYVDCFAYVGLYPSDKQDYFLKQATGPVAGSPMIGIRNLDSVVGKYPYVDVRVNAILIEENKRHYQTLLRNLSGEGHSPRIQNTTNFSSLAPGEIAVVNADATQLRDELLKYTQQRYTWAFYLLDPWGAKGIPLDFVSPIVNADHHDVMINFMYVDLHKKKSGTVEEDGQLLLKQPEHARRWTEAFGGGGWLNIVERIERERDQRDRHLSALGMTPDDIGVEISLKESFGVELVTDKKLTEQTEKELVELYQETLRKAAPGVAVKRISLSFPNRDRTFFYLFLTTHDGTGALKMNEVLVKARLAEKELKYIRRKSQKLAPPPQQGWLFAPEKPKAPKAKSPSRPERQEVAETIMEKLEGRTCKLRQVFIELADEIYFEREVRAAIKWLKDKGRARYRGNLTNKTNVTFGS